MKILAKWLNYLCENLVYYFYDKKFSQRGCHKFNHRFGGGGGGVADPQFLSLTSKNFACRPPLEYLVSYKKLGGGSSPLTILAKCSIICVRCLNLCNRPKGIHFCNRNSNLTFRLTTNQNFTYEDFFKTS